MPQTGYNLEPGIAVPGMPFSLSGSDVIEARPALVAIPFGVLVEIVVSGGIEYVQPVQDLTGSPWTAAKLYGVSVYDPAREQAIPSLGANVGINGLAGYAANEMVPVMRRGCIYVQTDGAAAWAAGGTSWPSLGAVNVHHSSDGTHAQGVFTMLAQVTTAGNEIDACPTTIIGRDIGRVQTYTSGFGATFNVAVVELNAPGST